MTFTTSRVAEDRDKPGTYISIVEFPSYEEAMKQSNHPALSEFIQTMGPELMTNQHFRTSTSGPPFSINARTGEKGHRLPVQRWRLEVGNQPGCFGGELLGLAGRRVPLGTTAFE